MRLPRGGGRISPAGSRLLAAQKRRGGLTRSAGGRSATRRTCAERYSRGWQETVSQNELTICLGDVTIGPALPAVDEAPAALPRTKMVIARNHDFAPLRPAPKNYSLEAVYPTLVCETDRTLLLTHEALDTVPADCINVHGHRYGAAGAPRSARHLNVNVEQLGHRPIRLAVLAATARTLLGGKLAVRRTTAETVAAASRQARRGRTPTAAV